MEQEFDAALKRRFAQADAVPADEGFVAQLRRQRQAQRRRGRLAMALAGLGLVLLAVVAARALLPLAAYAEQGVFVVLQSLELAGRSNLALGVLAAIGGGAGLCVWALRRA